MTKLVTESTFRSCSALTLICTNEIQHASSWHVCLINFSGVQVAPSVTGDPTITLTCRRSFII